MRGLKKAVFCLILVVFTTFVVHSQSKKVVVKKLNPQQLLEIIEKISVEEGVNPRLFATLIRAESRGKICISSHKGARGITQLMPATARRFGLVVNDKVDERCHLRKALRVGARYLRWQLDKFKDVRLALAGYNAGEGAVIKYGYRIPPYRETTQYVEKICAWAYGRSGMSLPMAYSERTAIKYVNALYRNGIGEFPLSFASDSDIYKLDSLIKPLESYREYPVQDSNLVSDEDVSDIDDQPEAKPPIRKVVKITDLEPRVSTRTLNFWNKTIN